MPVIEGNVGSFQYLTVIHNALINSGFEEISTDLSQDGRVYRSHGESGEDTWYLRLLDDNINNAYISVGVYENYTPGDQFGARGEFGLGYMQNTITWHHSSSSQRMGVNYVININKDRVIFYTSGEKAETNWRDSLVYAGLPKRYDPNDKGAGFAGLAASGYAHTNNHAWDALRNRSNQTYPNATYNFRYYNPPSAFGWGNQLFFSPMYIGSSNEGARGELDGLYICRTTDFELEMYHLDRFVKNGKEYMIIDGDSYQRSSTENLPGSHFYIMEV